MEITNSTYSEKERLEAINLFIAFGGNRARVSEALKIPYSTLRMWEKQEWWRDAYFQIKQQESLVLSAKLHKIVLKSLDELDDRIINGDHYYHQKSGQVLRKPVNARDLQSIVRDSIDRKLKLDKPTTEEQDASNIMDKLAALAKNFEAIAEKASKKAVVEVTDVVYIDSSSEETNKNEGTYNALDEER